jgi:SAM-dependent methyltransferase
MEIPSGNGLEPTTGRMTERLGAGDASARDHVRSLVLDRIAPQLGAFTWYRYDVTGQFFFSGPARLLNVGTGGGMETLRLLRRGNHVTTIEVDPATAAKTRNRVVRSGHGARHVGHAGHVLDVEVEGPFDGVVMCEVLEHIKDDVRTLQRVSQWLAPGGRLVLSTPTASYGQLPGDEITVHEDGGHVRVGYDGPELDVMLADVGIVPLRRVYLGHRLSRWHIRAERLLQARRLTVPLGLCFSLVSRPLMPFLDAFPGQPLHQITLAVKKHQ